MGNTLVRGRQVLDGSISRSDLDVSTVGEAVIRKVLQGTNISLSATGVDSGTGDVTVSLSATLTGLTSVSSASFSGGSSGQFQVTSAGAVTTSSTTTSNGFFSSASQFDFNGTVSGFAHGITNKLPTDYVYNISKYSGSTTIGGLYVAAVSKATNVSPIIIDAIQYNTTFSVPVMLFGASMKAASGNSVQSIASTDVGFQFQNNGAVLANIYGSGRVNILSSIFVGHATSTPQQMLHLGVATNDGIVLGTNSNRYKRILLDTATGTNDMLRFQSLGNTSNFQGGFDFDVSYNGGSIFNAMRILATTTGSTANVSVTAGTLSTTAGTIYAKASGTESSGYQLNGITVGYDSTNTLGWITAGGAAARTSLVLNQGGGSVGVGTSTMTEKFNVNGYVYATGYKVPSGTSSGFLKANGTVDTNTYLTTISGISAGGDLSGTYSSPTVVGIHNISLPDISLSISISGGLFYAYQSYTGTWEVYDTTSFVSVSELAEPLYADTDFLGNRAIYVRVAGASESGYLTSTDWNTFNNKQAALSGTGLVKSTAGTISYITDNSSNWNTAYTDRNKWDGGATGLTASTGRTSLGATTVGSNLFTLTNPSAVTFLRINADNTVSALDAASFRTAIGAAPSRTVEDNTTTRNIVAADNGKVLTDLGAGTAGMNFNLPDADSNIGFYVTVCILEGVANPFTPANSTSRITATSGNVIDLNYEKSSSNGYIDLNTNGVVQPRANITLISIGNGTWLSIAQSNAATNYNWSSH